MIFSLEKSVCFTGHRILKKNFQVSVLENTVEELINRGYVSFLCGMAIGFDLICFKVILKMKDKYPFIKAVACVPCPMQDKNYRAEDKKTYGFCIERADEVITVSPEYDGECMKRRDRFMVDNSSVCVSYLYKSLGGTYYTTKYAVEKQKEIIYIK